MSGFSLIPKLKNLGFSGVVAVAVATACGKTGESASSLQWVASTGMSSIEVNQALNATMAVQLNLKTNRATLYRNGTPQQQWNIASADVSGAYHGGEAKMTPEGVYGIEDIEHCPVWRPRDPVNPSTGKVAQSEAERWSVFNSQPEVYGPCGSSNPLGKYVFWFQGPYGMHGNSAEEILRLKNPDERRVSGGCVRNPNAKIKEVFHLALDAFPELVSFKEKVIAMESQPSQNKKTLTQSVRDINIRVVVGRWLNDPVLGGDNSNPDLPAATPTPPPTPTPTPIPQPVGPAMLCKAVAADSKSGVAPVHIRLPATPDNISAFYRLHDPVRVMGIIPGTRFYKTARGYIDKDFVGSCSQY